MSTITETTGVDQESVMKRVPLDSGPRTRNALFIGVFDSEAYVIRNIPEATRYTLEHHAVAGHRPCNLLVKQ